MSVMTILSCKILQDEIVHLLEKDPSVDEIIVVMNNEEHELISKLDAAGLHYVLMDLEQLPPSPQRIDPDRFTIIICLVELALHEFPKTLKVEVYERIGQMTAYSDGILLFYGLCGNVLDKVEEDFRDQEKTCPVRILRDEKRIVDDCIGATLGGGEEYLKTLKMLSSQGTFLFTPMYAHSWKEIMRVDPDKPENTLKMLRKVNEITGYKRVAKVNTGLHYTENFHEKVEEFAQIFDFDVLEIEGNQKIFQKCYASMKELMGIPSMA
ncbi:MAG: hypothetical protein PWR29_1409 [Methanolobus sp.]|nr:hypothetical protein [Methanolobus sp.]MDN5310712.1 hypothetical protein [Methanolobus sp.]